MAFDWGPVIGAGISAGASLLGGSAANDANKTIARETNSYAYSMWKAGNQFSAAQAKASRNWARLMSNNAVQRQVRDLQQAGINPILAGRYGGASTPAPATAGSISVPSLAVPKIQDVMTPAVNTGLQAYNAALQGEKTKADTKVSQRQEERIIQETEKISAEAVLNNAQTEAVYQGLEEITSRINLNRSKMDLNEAMQGVPQAATDLVEALRSLGNLSTPGEIKQAVIDAVEVIQNTTIKRNQTPSWGIQWRPSN